MFGESFESGDPPVEVAGSEDREEDVEGSKVEEVGIVEELLTSLS